MLRRRQSLRSDNATYRCATEFPSGVLRTRRTGGFACAAPVSRKTGSTPTTTIIQPAFGPETLTVPGGSPASGAIKNPAIYLIFEATKVPDEPPAGKTKTIAWTGGASGTATTLAEAADKILRSEYLSKLKQYGFSGIGNASALGQDWWVDSSQTDLGLRAQPRINSSCSSATSSRVRRSTSQAIRANCRLRIVTPNAGGAFTFGYNEPGPVLSNGVQTEIASIHVPVTADGVYKDGFTDVFSHEIVESITHLIQVNYPGEENNKLGKALTPGQIRAIFKVPDSEPAQIPADEHQIADGEPDAPLGSYMVRGNDGLLLQAYWSDSDQAFVVPALPNVTGFATWTFTFDATLGQVVGQVEHNASDRTVILSNQKQPVPQRASRLTPATLARRFRIAARARSRTGLILCSCSIRRSAPRDPRIEVLGSKSCREHSDRFGAELPRRGAALALIISVLQSAVRVVRATARDRAGRA